MFLQLNHKNLSAYNYARQLVVLCYKVANLLPQEERFGMITQIKRASLSVKLNIAEGASRKSIAERNRFYEIARGSAIELDAAFESACDLSYLKAEQLTDIGTCLNKVFATLTGLIK